jgi:NADPH-dependent 2,4-dienoyl-CoA reductase/sulfur reductase-like enzyme
VGGVAAGTSAAAKAKRLDPALDITLFEQGEFISYGACSMPYYIGDVIPDHERLIAYTPAKFREERGCEVRTLHRLEAIQPHRKLIVVRDLAKNTTAEFRYDKLVLATGARARVPDAAWLKAENVFSIKNLRDSIRLKTYLRERRPHRAVILGGGYIGMEMAEALVHHRLSVTVVHKDSLPMTGLEEEARRIVLDELTAAGVRFEADTAVLDVIQREGVATGVQTSKGAIDTDLVLLALGFQPNTEIAREAGVRCGRSGGILVDTKTRTSVEHIYAAGACTEVRNVVSNKPIYLPLGHIANKMGWVAGENIAGNAAEFPGVVRTTAVKVFRLEVASVGLGSREAADCGFRVFTECVNAPSRARQYPGSKLVFVKLIVDQRTGRLLGANLVGEEGAASRANVLSVLVQRGMTVAEMARLDLLYTPPFAPAWDPLLVAANQALKHL